MALTTPLRTSPRAAPRLPLALTADPDLLDDLIRLAAAGGTELDVAPDPLAAQSRYAQAPLVLIGLDQSHACLRADLPPRDRVVLVGRADVNGVSWQLAELIGAQHVALLPAAEPWLVDRLTEGPHGEPRGRTIALVGGRGGAGASVLAVGLAVTGVRAGLRTLLVDADLLGGGVDILLGWEDLQGLRWSALKGAEGRFHPPTLVRALPGRGDLAVVAFERGPLLAVPAETMAATMAAGRRARDLVVVDLPRRLDDAAVLALEAADQVLLVVPAEIRATAAAARVAAAVGPHCGRLSVVVRGPAPGGLCAREVAGALGLPLAGTLRPEAGLSAALEGGVAPAADGRGPLAALCQRILTDLVGPIGAVAA